MYNFLHSDWSKTKKADHKETPVGCKSYVLRFCPAHEMRRFVNGEFKNETCGASFPFEDPIGSNAVQKNADSVHHSKTPLDM